MAVRYKNLSNLFNSPAPAVARVIGVACFIIFGMAMGSPDTDPDTAVIGTISLLAAICATIFAYYTGRRREKAGYYMSELTKKKRVSITELAKKRRLTPNYTQYEISRLIYEGYIPGTGVLIADGFFSLVSETEPGSEEKRAVSSAERKTAPEFPDYTEKETGEMDPKKRAAEETVSKETLLVIKEGRAGVEAIKKVNASLPDEAISEKLGKLEKITEEIFNYVESHPEKVNDIRKLMSYHLPAALKLVKAYKELEALPVKAASIISAKTDIQNAVSTINVAFEKVLNDLYEDMVLDVTAEISALRVILAQDGLTRTEDFPADTDAEYGGETTDKEKNEKD